MGWAEEHPQTGDGSEFEGSLILAVKREGSFVNIQRRDFNKMLLAAVGGIVTGATVGCGSSEKKETSNSGGDAHVCKGKNACKGKGGCGVEGKHDCAGKNSCKGTGGCASKAARHECKGKNACKSMGGCKSGDGGCAGKNSCKGNGGCKVPLKG